ncbi:hypothetical protein [Streptomyces sp. NPDC001165]|uniref:hypothetical protein n=1 Tax=Streptomyces sp. NPDC001165 TaxID=3364546 RepID=UPI0036A57010
MQDRFLRAEHDADLIAWREQLVSSAKFAGEAGVCLSDRTEDFSGRGCDLGTEILVWQLMAVRGHRLLQCPVGAAFCRLLRWVSV